MRKLSLLLILITALVLAACGGDSAPSAESDQPVGDPSAGNKVFSEVAAPACNTCHSLQPGEDLVGPSLASVASVAGARVEGVSAEDYLRKSVTAPDSYVVEGYPPGTMTNTYGAQLSEQQLEDLVAYMLTLK